MPSEIIIPESLCQNVIALLPDYVLQHTTPEENQLIGALLPFCPDLRTALDEYRSLTDGLLRVVPPAGSPPPVDRLFTRITQLEAKDDHRLRESTRAEAIHISPVKSAEGMSQVSPHLHPTHRPIHTPAQGSLLRHSAGHDATWNGSTSPIDPASPIITPDTLGSHSARLPFPAQPVSVPAPERRQPPSSRQLLVLAAMLICLLGFNIYWIVRSTEMQNQQIAVLTQLSEQSAGNVSFPTYGVGDQYRKLAVTRSDMAQVQAVFTWNAFNHSGALYVTGMPPVEPSHVYQLWLVDDTDIAQSLGTFHSDTSGNAVLLFQSVDDPGRYKHIGVSIEPDQGSPMPTTPHIILGDL